MKLELVTYKEIRGSGIKATVSLHDENGKELHRSEVKLWHSESRTKFIKEAIKTARGDLTDNQRDQLRKEWDETLRGFENSAKKTRGDENTKSSAGTAAPPELTATEREQAISLLERPSLLFDVTEVIHRVGLAGETVNALILYLVMTSRLLDNILSAALKGESSVGKNTLIEMVGKLHPPEASIFLSGMSRQALIYSERDYRHKHIIIAEAEGARAATYNLRTLLSENCLKFETVEKSDDGQLRSRLIEKQGPTGLITATTLPRLHPENETRLLSLSLDESDEQTQRIKRASASKYSAPEKAIDLSPWVNAQRLLRAVTVHIPYAEYLADHTPEKPLRIRRDFNKLLSLIEVSATLHQFQRKTLEGGEIEANLADYFISLTLMQETFFNSLHGMHPNTCQVMAAIKEVETEPIETRDLMKRLGWNKFKVLRWAKPLTDYDWVIEGGRGNPDTYQIGLDPMTSTQRLPSVEQLAEAFPRLAREFSIIHPLTGDVLNLDDGTGSQESAAATVPA